jgi:hypothetical protein
MPKSGAALYYRVTAKLQSGTLSPAPNTNTTNLRSIVLLPKFLRDFHEISTRFPRDFLVISILTNTGSSLVLVDTVVLVQ